MLTITKSIIFQNKLLNNIQLEKKIISMQQGGILPFILFNGGFRKAIVAEAMGRELLRLQVSKGKTCI